MKGVQHSGIHIDEMETTGTISAASGTDVDENVIRIEHGLGVAGIYS